MDLFFKKNYSEASRRDSTIEANARLSSLLPATHIPSVNLCVEVVPNSTFMRRFSPHNAVPTLLSLPFFSLFLVDVIATDQYM